MRGCEGYAKIPFVCSEQLRLTDELLHAARAISDEVIYHREGEYGYKKISSFLWITIPFLFILSIDLTVAFVHYKNLVEDEYGQQIYG